MSKVIKAWILTNNKDYFHVWMKKPPDGFSKEYKRYSCEVSYKIDKEK